MDQPGLPFVKTHCWSGVIHFLKVGRYQQGDGY
jgi:hypothetical protein